MRVLFLGLLAGNRSGTGRYVRELAPALAALPEGPEVVLTWPDDLPRPAEGPRLRVLPMSPQPLARLWQEQGAVKRLMRQQRCDLVHYPATVGPLFSNAPAVVTVHDLAFLPHPEWFRPSRVRYYRRAVLRGVQRARGVIADSAATAGDVETFYGLDASVMTVAHLGVDARFSPTPAAGGIEAPLLASLPQDFFLFVGTIEPRKNLPRLLRAWDAAAREIPQDLVIAGRRGWGGEAFDAARETLKHAKRLHVVPHIEEGLLPAVMRRASGFVWPSLYEGFGLPPVEAMACGAPVLTSNAGSLPEVTGDAAILVDPKDEAAIADGLRRLADPATAAALREKGLARAAHFTWPRCAQAVYEAYQRALPPK